MTWQPNRQKFLNGGYAIPLGNNISLLMGNSHEQGGITGITPKDDIEAEGGEVIQKTKDSKGGNVLRIFSKYPMFGNHSPSELVQAGVNPNEVFKKQEQYKDRLGLNDDGTPKQRAKYGDRIEYELGGNKNNQQQEEKQPFVVPGTGLNLETAEDYKQQQLQQFSETTGLPIEYLEELFENDDFTAESLADFKNETNADNSKIPVNNEYEDTGLFDLFPQQKQEVPVQTPIKNNIEDNIENDEENVSENEEQKRKLYKFNADANEDDNFVNPSLQQNEDDYYTPYDDEYLDSSDLDKPVYSVNDVNPSILPTRKEKEYKLHSETDITNVLNNKSTRAVTDEIWNTLNESDLTYAQKIAIMANWYQESTWRPNVKTGDNGNSYGLAQFNKSGEWQLLEKYAKENNLDITKASTQTKFAIKRIKDKGGLRRTKGTIGFEDITKEQAFEMWNSEDPEEATIAYMLLYERPSWAASGNRINAARVLQRIYKSDSDSTAISKKLGGEFKLGGLSRSKDYGSKKKPYPSVNKKDFAGGHRSYPIPTKADARDALRLAGLHHRSDVRAKVYKKYPSLRKKAELGLKEDDENNQDDLNNFSMNFMKILEDFHDVKNTDNARLKYKIMKNDINSPEYTPGHLYLMNPKEQAKRMFSLGYIQGKNGDYGTVASKVARSSNPHMPVYQRYPDQIKRSQIVPIGRGYRGENFQEAYDSDVINTFNIDNGWLIDPKGHVVRNDDEKVNRAITDALDANDWSDEYGLIDPGNYQFVLYRNPNTGDLYTNAWDVNNYADKQSPRYQKYPFIHKIAANILDFIGNPFVQTLGYQKVPLEGYGYAERGKGYILPNVDVIANHKKNKK